MSNPLNVLIPGRTPEQTVYRWGTVTQTSPSLLVRLDGDSVPLAGRPSTLARVEVNDRVFTVTDHRRVTVLGVAGGIDVPDPSQPWPTQPGPVPGENGIYTNFTPTMRVGNGTGAEPTWGSTVRTGRYTRIGDQVNFSACFQFASNYAAGSAGSTWTMPLPVQANIAAQGNLSVYVRCLAWTGESHGFSRLENQDYAMRLWADTGTSHQLVRGDRGWTSPDILIVSGTYEAA